MTHSYLRVSQPKRTFFLTHSYLRVSQPKRDPDPRFADPRGSRCDRRPPRLKNIVPIEWQTAPRLFRPDPAGDKSILHFWGFVSSIPGAGFRPSTVYVDVVLFSEAAFYEYGCKLGDNSHTKNENWIRAKDHHSSIPPPPPPSRGLVSWQSAQAILRSPIETSQLPLQKPMQSSPLRTDVLLLSLPSVWPPRRYPKQNPFRLGGSSKILPTASVAQALHCSHSRILPLPFPK